MEALTSPENLANLDVFSAHTFATIIGVKAHSIADGLGDVDAWQSEEKRLWTLGNFLLCRNDMQPVERQKIIWAEFCALYLPATVDRYINPPVIPSKDPADIAMFRILNPCGDLMDHLQFNPYFAKYFRSQTPLAANGKKLPRVVAERIADVAFDWESELRNETTAPARVAHLKTTLASSIQLLSTLCTTFIKETDQDAVIPAALRARLKPLMRLWFQRNINENLGHVTLRVWGAWSLEIRELSDTLVGEIRKVRKKILGWDICGLPECNMSNDLKTCSKCQTVR